MFCSKCGAELPDGAQFCSKCGQKTGGESSPSEAAQSAPVYSAGGAGYEAQSAPVFSTDGGAVGPETDASQPYTAPAAAKQRPRGCLIVFIVLAVIFALIFVFGVVFSMFGSYSDGSSSATGYSGTASSSSSSWTSGDYDYQYGGVYGEDVAISGLRDKYTVLKGDGSDTATVMVYMIASDLESEGGFATSDLQEMIGADSLENINLVLQTGGTSKWNNSVMTSGICQRWLVSTDGLYALGDVGRTSMTSADTLGDFIRFSAEKYPADRYILILWDHGGGTMYGYGYDELYPNSSMSLYALDKALTDGGVKFDFVGFDACLMSTLETAYMLEEHADYLIASEETEPGCGWSYSGWLSALNSDTSIDTVKLGARVADDYVSACKELGSTYGGGTLAVTDLREIPYAYDMMCDFLKDSDTALSDYKYDTISRARSDARGYGEGNYQQVDVVDLAYRMGMENSDAVIAAVKSAVKYRNQTDDMAGSHGLAMYFPYTDYSYYNNVLQVENSIGLGDEYTGFFTRFLNAMLSGRSMKQNSAAQQLTGNADASATENYTQYDWYDPQTAASLQGNYTALDETLPITQKGDEYVLSLTDEQWSNIVKLELQVFADDGEGYIDLGSDDFWEFDDDGDLYVRFDYQWVTLDGTIVPYYAESYDYTSDDWYSYGYVPAEIGGEDAEIVVRWDADHPDGFVAGYRRPADTQASKGLIELTEGTAIDIVCNYYTYDGTYDDQYYLGDTLTVPAGGLTVSYGDIGNSNTLIWYALTDIHQNVSYTESVSYTD
ncbi:MAG: clostripain-related cysteine peptidase [Oscillospiraceae bacterium]|nr:clostripain-related cysteine peptidase [Oscillospiraceae bacterium]